MEKMTWKLEHGEEKGGSKVPTATRKVTQRCQLLSRRLSIDILSKQIDIFSIDSLPPARNRRKGW